MHVNVTETEMIPAKCVQKINVLCIEACSAAKPRKCGKWYVVLPPLQNAITQKCWHRQQEMRNTQGNIAEVVRFEKSAASHLHEQAHREHNSGTCIFLGIPMKRKYIQRCFDFALCHATNEFKGKRKEIRTEKCTLPACVVVVVVVNTHV